MVTNPVASNASRSRRTRSSRTQRQPRQSPAQGRRHRHRGDHRHGDDHGEEILAERAHRQADRRDDHLGRAAGVHAATKRQGFSCAQAAKSAPEERSGELAEARDQNQTDGQKEQGRVSEDGQVGVQAGKRKEDGHEQGDDEAPQLFVDVAGQDRRLADEYPGHERTQHGMYADQMRGERHRAHDDENCGDHRHFADKIVVGPADDAEHETPPECKARRKKDCRSEHALTQGERVHLSVNREAER